MPTPAKIGLIVFVLLALGLWVLDTHPHLADASTPSVSLVPLKPGVLTSKANVSPSFQETGVLMYDLAAGAPGVPYLVYVNEKGELMTKQLIFSDRACDVTAGDLPCVDSEDDNPSIPAGTPLAVNGGSDVQGVFADSYQATTTPSDMVVFSAALNEPVTLSDGSSITLLGIADDTNCTISEGCFVEGTNRAVVQISTGKVTKTEQFVPGSLHEFGKTTFIVLSINGSAENVSVSMLAVAPN